MEGNDNIMNLGPLQDLLSDNSLAKLEPGVTVGLQILDDVKKAFINSKSLPEIAQWIQSTDKLQSQTEYQRTVVAVVGSTGAGKSSVINAVLDEECLVPTSCMRACTAVITEIAFNYSDLKDERYRAEIEFINKENWIKDLRIMLDDMTSRQNSFGSEQASSESEASIAYHKIRSVYPFLSSEDIKKGNVNIDELTEHASVKELLGGVKQFASPTSKDFMEHLKKYIDSKEKTPGRKKETEAMEYWPLIKVVKVFVRSPILKSGLVLVDLPGVHDSNAARSAVASKYIEQCSGLWVVAPITRAVDDRVAQNLLGNSFKRQLQFGGTYSSVTVICSKADDISVTEALKVLPEGEEGHQFQAHVQLLEGERDQLQEAFNKSKGRDAELNADIEQRLTEIEELKAAFDGSDDEDDALLVSPRSTRKRPSRVSALEARKRLRQHSESEDTFSD
ncbi:hypothetical protein VTI74DRAFT_7698 [Chaetomium olivicolor]